MLAKLYDALIILLILTAAGVIGFIYWNRSVIFEKVNEVINPSNIPENLVAKEVKINSRWLSGASNIRNKSFYTLENINSILYAADLNSPGKIAVHESIVMVTEPLNGNVVVLQDTNSDNSADVKYIFASGLQKPYGIAFYEGNLYVAEENEIIVFENFEQQYANKTSNYTTLVSGLPTGGSNPYKSLLVGPDNKIFVGVGSSCNTCVESDRRRGSIVTYNLDGSTEEIYATGIRNTKDMEFVRGSFYFTEESIDSKKYEVYDELNLLEKNSFYGWPSLVGENEPYKGSSTSFESTLPIMLFEDLSNPSGIEYVDGKLGLDNSILISLSGYDEVNELSKKIVRVDLQSKLIEDVILFNIAEGIIATPHDIINYNRGILVTDSLNGVIYYFY